LQKLSDRVRSVAAETGQTRTRGGDVLIDCETCTVRGIGCCDCVINVFLAHPAAAADPPPALDLDESERRAVGALAACGLVPPLRLISHPTAERRDRSA